MSLFLRLKGKKGGLLQFSVQDAVSATFTSGSRFPVKPGMTGRASRNDGEEKPGMTMGRSPE